MEIQNILSNYTYTFLLVMIRYIGLFISAPILSSRVTPLRIRLSFVFFLTIITIPIIINIQVVEIPITPVAILLAVLSELVIGVIIGFIATLVFAAIQLAGQFIDLRMGFAMANVVDPITGANAPLMGQFKNILAILLFFAINGHHFLIRAVFHSYSLIPLGVINFSGSLFEYIIKASAEMFQLAIMISLPVMGTVFVADIIFGFVARSIPQMNIFIIGFPLKIIIGFLVLILSLHLSLYYIEDLFYGMYKQLYEIITLLG